MIRIQVNVRYKAYTDTVYYDIDKEIVIDYCLPALQLCINFSAYDSVIWGLLCLDEDDYVHMINKKTLKVTKVTKQAAEDLQYMTYCGVQYAKGCDLKLYDLKRVAGVDVYMYRKLPTLEVAEYVEEVEVTICRGLTMGLQQPNFAVIHQLNELADSLTARFPIGAYSYTNLYEAVWKLLIKVPYRLIMTETLEWGSECVGDPKVTGRETNMYAAGVSNNIVVSYRVGYCMSDLRTMFPRSLMPNWVNDGLCVMSCEETLREAKIQAICLELEIQKIKVKQFLKILNTYCREIDFKNVTFEKGASLMLYDNVLLRRIHNVPSYVKLLICNCGNLELPAENEVWQYDSEKVLMEKLKEGESDNENSKKVQNQENC